MRGRPALLLGACLAMAAAGCRHAPVAANYGSAYIASQPPQAEIILDGQLLTQPTPAEIVGIPGGVHQLRLRHINYASIPTPITIRPSVINRFSVALIPQSFRLVDTESVAGASDAVIDRAAGLVYVAAPHAIYTVRIVDTSLVRQQLIAVSFTPEALAVDARSAYLCCLGRRPDSTRLLAVIDRTTMAVTGLDSAAEVQGLSEIAFSPDGGRVIGADPAGRRLVFFDPSTAGTMRTEALPMSPDHIGVGPDGRFYAASLEPPRLAWIDLTTGAIDGSAATASRPGGIFWDDRGRTAGVWDRVAKTITLVNADTWASATGLGNIGGDTLFAVCWSPDPDYLLALTFKWEPIRVESNISSVFLPEWTAYGQMTTGASVFKKILPVNDQHRVVILETLSGKLLLVWINI